MYHLLLFYFYIYKFFFYFLKYYYYLLYLFRSLGDVIDKFGDLMPRYYANERIFDNENNFIGFKCRYDSSNPERHPLRWFLTRQIGCTLWCTGEIVGDWYPLFRTKAMSWDKKSILLVYFTCGLFNFSKISLFVYHYKLLPSQLYDKDGVYDQDTVDKFYFPYWYIQILIIYTSVIYDFSVYYVLRKNLSKISQSNIGFIKKFKMLSQYRILVSTFICFAFLPIISITLMLKIYFFKAYNYHKLNFSFDEIRQSITNVQYFMIFIDQILLLHKNDDEDTRRVTLPSSMSSGNYYVDNKSNSVITGNQSSSHQSSLYKFHFNKSNNNYSDFVDYKNYENSLKAKNNDSYNNQRDIIKNHISHELPKDNLSNSNNKFISDYDDILIRNLSNNGRSLTNCNNYFVLEDEINYLNKKL